MMVDAYGLASSSASPEARAAFETAQRAFAGHRPQTAFAIGASLSADPHHIPALALKGFGQVLLARAELGAEAHATLAAATAAVNESADATQPRVTSAARRMSSTPASPTGPPRCFPSSSPINCGSWPVIAPAC
jgi:hypothetical protein